MKVTFNFKKSTCRLNWIKILKVVFGFNLKEAKAIVDSGSYVHIVDGLNNPIDMQQYFVDLLIRIDSVCISTLDADQRKVELRDVISLSIFDKEENVPSNTPAVQTINVQDLDTVKRRQYHKSNCDSTVRAIVTDPLGRKVILVGKHAFEWSIILEKEGRLVITTFPNREQAVDTFNKKYRNK